jgi:hypothetical protein
MLLVGLSSRHWPTRRWLALVELERAKGKAQCGGAAETVVYLQVHRHRLPARAAATSQGQPRRSLTQTAFLTTAPLPPYFHLHATMLQRT